MLRRFGAWPLLKLGEADRDGIVAADLWPHAPAQLARGLRQHWPREGHESHARRGVLESTATDDVNLADGGPKVRANLGLEPGPYHGLRSHRVDLAHENFVDVHLIWPGCQHSWKKQNC
eukprot:9501303-Pyramimonas_sp.AAC.1